MKVKAKISNGFTLIELLVVIAIIGVLMGIVGPKVFDLLTTSEKTKYSSIISSWATSFVSYKTHYGFFPPFLYEEEEGTSVRIDTNDQHDAFTASLKGKFRNLDTGAWDELTDTLQSQNSENKEFHSFAENEFNHKGEIIGFGDLHIMIDKDGDGSIQLEDQMVDDILESLAQDYSKDQIDEVDRDLFGVINQPVLLYIIQDPLSESDDESVFNVFSWNIEKHFD